MYIIHSPVFGYNYFKLSKIIDDIKSYNKGLAYGWLVILKLLQRFFDNLQIIKKRIIVWSLIRILCVFFLRFLVSFDLKSFP